MERAELGISTECGRSSVESHGSHDSERGVRRKQRFISRTAIFGKPCTFLLKHSFVKRIEGSKYPHQYPKIPLDRT